MGEEEPPHYGGRSTTSGMSGTLTYSQRTTHQEVLIAIYSEHFMACLHTFGHHIFEIVLWWSCLMRCPFLNSHFYPHLLSLANANRWRRWCTEAAKRNANLGTLALACGRATFAPMVPTSSILRTKTVAAPAHLLPTRAKLAPAPMVVGLGPRLTSTESGRGATVGRRRAKHVVSEAAAAGAGWPTCSAPWGSRKGRR